MIKLFKITLLSFVLAYGTTGFTAAFDVELANARAEHALSHLPSFPKAPEDKATLLGVDSDNDGLRDDFEHLIAKKYSEGSYESRVMAYGAYSLDLQMIAGATQDQKAWQEAVDAMQFFVSCTMYLKKDQQLFIALIESFASNTKQRSDAAIAFDMMSGGTVMPVAMYTKKECGYAELVSE